MMKRFLKAAAVAAMAAMLAVCFSGCRTDDPEDTQVENPDDSGSSGGSSVGSSEKTQAEFIKSLGSGWNLGNTFDAKSDGSGTDNLGLSTETSWGLPYTTEAMVKAVAAKGLKTIRIPVSWHNHITSRTGYTIDSAWMNRVKTVVDWSLNAGLNVIINIHHDNMSESGMSSNAGFCITTDSTLKSKSESYVKCVWSQIAAAFKDYDSRLIFEVLNEPRAIGSSYEWDSQSGTYNSQISAANALIMVYEKDAIAAIRGAGGNNSSRYIMVPPYAASPNCMTGWSLPSDSGSATGKLIVSVHAYTPYEFAMSTSSVTGFTSSHQGSIDWLFNLLNDTFLSNNIPVVIGEASASDKNNTAERVKWAKYYYGKAKALNVPVVLWDNMVTVSNGGNIDSGECHGYLNRNSCSWYFPTVVAEFTK